MYSLQNNHWDFVTGYEYESINVAAPWRKSSDHLMVREGIYLISDDSTSVYTQDLSLNNRPQPGSTMEVGNGLEFNTHSHLFEGNYYFNPDTRLHYAHRFDIPNMSSTMFSPRLGLVSKMRHGQTLTVTAQRALRMMPLRAQYLYYQSGDNNNKEHEKIDSLEFAYNLHSSNKAAFVARTYYNDIDAVGYTGFDLQFLANIKLAGLELETQYKFNNLELIANHAYVKQLGFEMNEELKTGSTRNNISYSDYYYFSRGDVPVLLEDYGEGLNNTSENTTKLIATQSFLNDKLSVQLNVQIFWDYRGAYDEMGMYQQAYARLDQSDLDETQLETFAQQEANFEHERELIEAEDAYKTQFNVGASVTYLRKIKRERQFKATVYMQNLFDNRYRYYVNTGSNNYYPNRLNFMKEPTVFGIRFEFSL